MGRVRVRLAVISVCLLVVGLVPGCDRDEEPRSVVWDAPPPRVVSAWAEEPPFAYNTYSDVDGSGRWVAFMHSVRDGAPGVYLRDMRTEKITRLDVWQTRPQPVPGSPEDERGYRLGSAFPSISTDGRYVAFHSGSPYLLPRDHNGTPDVFRYDRVTARLELVSVDRDGRQANRYSVNPSISADGRFVAFQSRASNLGSERAHQEDIYVKDMKTGEVELVSVGQASTSPQGTVFNPSISEDGTRVAFISAAGDLVEDDTNRATDAFVADLVEDTVTRVSVTSDGGQLVPLEYSESASSYRDGIDDVVLSGNGNVVAFVSHANGLVPEDENNNVDVFTHDLRDGITERVSVTSNGDDAYPRESDRECGLNGQCFTFVSSGAPSISRDGRYVAFSSGSRVLGGLPGNRSDGMVFLHDRETGLTVPVSRDRGGRAVGSNNYYYGDLSLDARWITFSTDHRLLGRRAGTGENGDVYLQQIPIPFEIAT